MAAPVEVGTMFTAAARERRKSLPLVELYFEYVEKNVHFTAYTQNVESASEFIYIISPYLDQQKYADLLAKRIQMLETADEKRNAKTY